jgi:hypothetical protein
MTTLDTPIQTDPADYRNYWRNVDQDIIVGTKYIVVGAVFIAAITALPVITAASVVSGAILGTALKGINAFADSLWDSREGTFLQDRQDRCAAG